MQRGRRIVRRMGLGFALLLWLAVIAWWFWRFDEATRYYHWGVGAGLVFLSGLGYAGWTVVAALIRGL
jgi:hypothetical protein